MKETYIIGIDIGGTAIKFALIEVDGKINHKWEIPTERKDKGSYIPEQIAKSVKEKLAELHITEQQILGIGAGAPGYVDVQNGVVYEAINLGWKDFHLKQRLEEFLNMDAYILNDANLAALGEHWTGAGRDSDQLIAVTLGTGVGGGIIVNGEVINGVNGTGGEIGHITATPHEGPKCNCGRQGCIETYASATGITRQALHVIERDQNTTLKEVYKTKGKLSSKDVFEQAANGDQAAQSIIDYTADVMGKMLADLAVSINPSKIIIAGGVSQAGEQLLQPVRKSFHSYALKRVADVCQIVQAQLVNDAGVVGAAYYVKQRKSV
ncbi:ROK family glucokinase [Virgibacillus sp. MSP4-1]|uniref:ROK family glucokinase n=1 Tax=Virgibacillus sp. MSP4-1 TaxID=2700081 RepID=UPI0003A0ABD1|nr:ROK family glucokinase [Virgibacillus sp. MSP4-1]QHS22756.1 ROK family glucokinase [Virgibacillus sp. MSP4-1]